jgi:hypothetical protein
MLDKSLFISDDVQQREIELADGSKHTMFFKQVQASVFRKFGMAERSEDQDVRAGSMAVLIAASLCDEKGEPVVTYDQALRLKPEVSTRFFNAAMEVNGAAKTEEGNA